MTKFLNFTAGGVIVSVNKGQAFEDILDTIVADTIEAFDSLYKRYGISCLVEDGQVKSVND